MDGAIDPELRDSVAILRLGVSQDGRLTAASLARLSDDLDHLEKRADPVKAVVLTGTGGRFANGVDHADLVEQGAIGQVSVLAKRLASWPSPVVAAIDGAAGGAATELALAARFRVMQENALISMADVLIGLPPIAGGTKRLPGLIGADRALTILLGGRVLKGADALRVGLVDLVAEDGAAAAAESFIRDRIEEGATQRRPRSESGSAFLRAVAAHKSAAQSAAIEAPARIIELVEAGRIVPTEIFENMEEIAFDDLWASDHARALGHIDRAERAAARLQRMVKPKARPVTEIALAGTRGSAPGLAIAALSAGYQVTISEADEETLEAGVVGIIEHFDAESAAGRLTEDAAEETLDRMRAVSGYRTLDAADMVFDVVNARGAASKALITLLDGAMKPGAVLVTGSTQVGPDAIAAITSRKADVVAARFFGENGGRRAVEVTPGSATDPLALGTVLTVLNRMRRLPIVTRANARGVGARMMSALHATADHLLEQGASIALIDGVARAWGLPQGSFAARDAHGITAPSPKTGSPGAGLGLDRVLASQGRRGRAVGRGYYRYEAGQIAHDPEVAALVDALRARKGITPRTLSADDVRLSLIAAMANAGAGILADGSLARPGQVDLLSVHGLGLARRAGGVLMSADLAGLDRVRARLKTLSEENPALPGPQPIFAELFQAGRRFADLGDA